MTKLAIVTGAGQGIGEGIAYRLAQDNYAIAVADINIASAKKVAQKLIEAGKSAKAYYVDVANRKEIFRLIQSAVSDLGELDAFINNAGVAFIASIKNSKPQQVNRLFDVNIKGTYWGIQAASEQFRKQGHGGHIVNAGSLAGVQASALQSAYSASKFAVRGLTQSAAKELAKDKITVNAYNPGVVRTPLRDMIDEKTAPINKVSISQQQKNVLKEISLGKEASPKDVANVVAWFVSPSASYVTGQSLLVDGGMVFQ